MTNDQCKAIMMTIVYCAINISNDWAIDSNLEKEMPAVDTAEKIVDEICDRFTSMGSLTT